MNLSKLAWKNLGRHRRRTLITASALVFGILSYVILDSVLKGATDESLINLTRYETGSGVIADPAYYKQDYNDIALSKTLSAAESERIAGKLAEAGILYAPRLSFGGEILFERGAYSLRITAIDPRLDRHIFALHGAIMPGGGYISAGGHDILLGEWLARDLGLTVGDSATLFFNDSQDVADFTVSGIINSPNPQINRDGVFISIDLARDYLLRPGITGGFALLAADDPTLDGLSGAGLVGRVEKLVADEPRARFVSWRLMAADFLSVLEGDQYSSGIMLLLVFLVAAIGISNTLLMSLIERRGEIGMMRAIGMDDKKIAALMLREVALVGIIGSVGGILLGALVNYFVVRYGFDYSALIQEMNIGYRVRGVLYGKWDSGTFIVAFFSGPLFSLLIGKLALRKSMRQGISEQLQRL